jgi:hypothetical protein
LPWVTREWDADSYESWHPAPDETYQHLHAIWREGWVNSRRLVDEALAEGGLDVLARKPMPNGESPSLRWIVVHMI